MCTAVSYKTKEHYFGRNLDYDISYGEAVAVTPRRTALPFRRMPDMPEHYAMIGMATAVGNYPLYYDAVNEKGVGMAGLLFAGNADYKPEAEGKENVSPFEFIPWILGQCATMEEVRERLACINLVDIPFNDQYPLSPLHWMISDGEESLIVESVKSGLHIYENPVGVLANNPPFDVQMLELSRYMNLSTEEPKNLFSDKLDLAPYSRGMGALGLPGDLSSPSRFVKAAFTRMNSVSGDSEEESVSQFFHILGSVEQQRGCVHMGGGKYEITLYSSCCNTDRGIYYYTTYENRQITAVDMHKEDLDGSLLITYPLLREQKVCVQNENR